MVDLSAIFAKSNQEMADFIAKAKAVGHDEKQAIKWAALQSKVITPHEYRQWCIANGRPLPNSIFTSAPVDPAGRIFDPKLAMKRPPLPFVVEGMFLRRKVSLVAGAPGVSKSQAMIQICVAMAAGVTWAGAKPFEAENLRVIGIFLEEDDGYLDQRIAGFMKRHNLPDTSTGDRLRLFSDLHTEQFRLITEDRGASTVLQGNVDNLINIILDHRADLVVIDPLAEVSLANENSNQAMSMLMSRMKHVAVQTDAAIVLVHHTSKASGELGKTDSMHAIRGASALVGAVKTAYALYPIENEKDPIFKKIQQAGAKPKDFVAFNQSKSNVSAPWPRLKLLRREQETLPTSNGPITVPVLVEDTTTLAKASAAAPPQYLITLGVKRAVFDTVKADWDAYWDWPKADFMNRPAWEDKLVQMGKNKADAATWIFHKLTSMGENVTIDDAKRVVTEMIENELIFASESRAVHPKDGGQRTSRAFLAPRVRPQ